MYVTDEQMHTGKFILYLNISFIINFTFIITIIIII
jgi:hypothetical protein